MMRERFLIHIFSWARILTYLCWMLKLRQHFTWPLIQGITFFRQTCLQSWYFYLQVKVYFSERDHWFHAVCLLHNDLQSNASYTNFKRDRDKNNKLGGFRCAKKTTLLSPNWGHIIFYNVSKNISICGDILKLVHFYCSVWFLGQTMQWPIFLIGIGHIYDFHLCMDMPCCESSILSCNLYPPHVVSMHMHLISINRD